MPSYSPNAPPSIIGHLPAEIVLMSAESSSILSVQATQIVASGDGRYFAAVTEDAVTVYLADRVAKVCTIPVTKAALVSFSPASTYLITCQQRTQKAATALNNLQVWNLGTGEVVLELSITAVTKENWPCLHWTFDESAALMMTSDGIQLFARSDNFTVSTKTTVKGVGSLAVSPNPTPMIAAFVPEAKGSPATAFVCPYSTVELISQVHKSFHRTSGAQLLWNSKGTALLVLSNAGAGQSLHHAAQQLHYLPADPARADLASRVHLPKEGPIHDVQWSPNGDYFVVVAGHMPSCITLFDADCKPVYDLGNGPYNLARWNPFGRFLCVAGLGNLPGDIAFFELKPDGSCSAVGSARHSAVSLEWAPDGQHVLAAKTAPTATTGNGVQVFACNGQRVWHRDFEVLYDAQCVTWSSGTCEKEPQSPSRAAPSQPAAIAAASSTSTVSSYLPPHLRNTRAGTAAAAAATAAAAAAAARFSPLREDYSREFRLKQAASGQPGAELVSKLAAKNSRKRSSNNESNFEDTERKRARFSHSSYQEKARRGSLPSVHAVLRPGIPLASSFPASAFPDKPSPPLRDDDKDGHYVYELGENLTSRYKILSKIGEGTFGRVLECWDRKNKEYVAIKIVRNVEKYRQAAMIELEVLNTLEKNDPENTRHCVVLREWFDFRKHVCMVFEKLGTSLFDFLKRNEYRPFPLDVVQRFGHQLLEAVAYFHQISLVHTDLKPENIMLVSQDHVKISCSASCRLGKRLPASMELKVIDFGSATFEEQYHCTVVSTRHYRAPEVILGMGWSYPCDIWSIGCILAELLIGDALFQTHDNIEHLAMMQQVLGPLPALFAAQCHKDNSKYFKNTALNWPAGAPNKKSVKAVKKMFDLRMQLLQHADPLVKQHLSCLSDLLFSLLRYDPSTRITAAEALHHPFFKLCFSQRSYVCETNC